MTTLRIGKFLPYGGVLLQLVCVRGVRRWREGHVSLHSLIHTTLIRHKILIVTLYFGDTWIFYNLFA
jgi:hypothetical protein